MCNTFHPSVLHKWPSVTASLWSVFSVAGIMTFHLEVDCVGQGHPDYTKAEVRAVWQNRSRWGWLHLTCSNTLHYTSESSHAFLLYICTDVFHISGWIFREAFQKMIQLALQMELEENISVLSILKPFCQHLFWAFSGLGSGIPALAREKGIIFCWAGANLPLHGYAQTLWRPTFVPASAPPRASGGRSRCRSKLLCQGWPQGIGVEPGFPCTCSSGLLKAAKELDAGDESIDGMTWFFHAPRGPAWIGMGSVQH